MRRLARYFSFVAFFLSVFIPAHASAQSADLEIVLHGPDPFEAGMEYSTFNVVLNNLGTDPADDISVSVALPPNVVFLELYPLSGNDLEWTITPPAVGTTGTLTATLSTLAASEYRQFSFRVRLDPNATVGSTVTTTATVSSSTSDPDSSSNSSDVVSTVGASRGNLGLVVGGAETSFADRDLLWRLQYQNASNGQVANVVITYPLPAGTTFVSLEADTTTTPPTDLGNWTVDPPAVGATGTITLTRAVSPCCSAAAGPEGFNVKLHSDPTLVPGDAITSVVTVTGALQDNQPSSNLSSWTTLIVPDDQGLAMNTSASANPVASDTDLTYTVSLFDGNQLVDASDVVMTFVVPPGTTFVSYTSPDPAWTEINVPAVGAGGSLTLQRSTLLHNTGDGVQNFEITVHVTGLVPVLDSYASGSATNMMSTETRSKVGVGATAAVTPLVVVGQVVRPVIGPGTKVFDYFFYAFNPEANGTADVEGGSVVVTLPAGMTWNTTDSSRYSLSPGATYTVDGTATQLTLDCGTLPQFGGCSMYIFHAIDVADTALGVKTITAAGNSTNTGPSVLSQASILVVQKATLTKDFAPTTVAVGGTSTLTFHVGNPNTDQTLHGVTFGDTLPTGLVIATPANVSSTCGGTLAAAAGTDFVGLAGTVLAPTTTCQISLDVTAVGDGLLNNTTTPILAAETGLDFDTTGAQGTASLAVPMPDLTITKSHVGDFGEGTAGTYKIVVTNSGLAPTTGTVTVTDQIQWPLTALPSGSGGWTCTIDAPNNTFTCTRSDVLAAGDHYSDLLLNVAVGPYVTTTSNLATVSGGGEFNTTNDDSAWDDTNVIAVPTHLGLAGPGTASPTTPFGFTVAVLDATDNLVGNYQGTVHFTTTDVGSGVAVPADYTFQLSDAGQATFSATLVTPGTMTITGTAGALTGSVGVNVDGGVGTTTTITSALPDPAHVGEGITVQFQVTADDSSIPTGSVTVTASSGESCTGTLAPDGTGSCVITILDACYPDLIAHYPGAPGYYESSSDPYSIEVEPAERYVATTGADTGACTDPDNPCATVQYAISQALPGDSVNIASGTYTNQGDTITVDKDIVLAGDPDGSTILQAAATPGTAGFRVLTIESSPTVEIYDLTIRNGQAVSVNGGGILNDGDLTLDGVTLTGNRSESGASGGAIANDLGGIVLIHNCTISGNSAGGAGGGIFSESFVLIDQSTIVDNVADADDLGSGTGGGLAVVGVPPDAGVIVSDSILSGNRTGTATPVAGDCTGDADAKLSLGYNVIGDAQCPNDIGDVNTDLLIDPATTFTTLLGPLANNGGPAPTHNLRAGSVAIDLDPGGCGCTGVDQRYVPRPQGAGLDAGAVEYLAVTRFLVSAPATTTHGTPFSATVTAVDATDTPVTLYNGTVHFTSTDGASTLPADTVLTNGTATVSATLVTLGSQTITATDTGDDQVLGTSDAIVVTAGPATHFTVTAPGGVLAGASFSVTVTALDADDNVDTSYAGTVHFTSSDGAAVLPVDTALTSGTGTFSATLATAGGRTITATDTVDGSINGTATITVGPASATHFGLSAPAVSTAAAPLAFTVFAYDDFNNVDYNYAGTVHFTSSDGGALLPADTPLTNGAATLGATLFAAGSQTITATDGGITGTSNTIDVSAGAATQLVVSALGTATAGTAFSFGVEARDNYGNIDTLYGGTVHFTSTDAAATLPANSTLTGGTGTFSATLETGGSQTITATDTVTASITGTSNAISVSAGAATHFAVSAPPAAGPGAAFSITVTALDAFDNTATGYAGTVHFTSTDGAAVLPANAGLVNGAGTFSATLSTLGPQTITATDTVVGTITGTANITVIGARYVATAGADAGDCSSAATACLTLNYAISQAFDGETVFIAAGTYTSQFTIFLEKDLTLAGDPTAPTVLAGTHEHRVFQLDVPTNTGTLRDLILRDGFEPVGTAAGGIANWGTLTLDRVTVTQNQADLAGGIFNAGTLTILNSTISGNTANDLGGGILSGGTLDILNSTISGNTANSAGGIWSSAALDVRFSTITDNQATSNATTGGVLVFGGTYNVTTSIVAGNRANVSSTPVPSDCLFSGGSITSGGRNVIGLIGKANCPSVPADIVVDDSVGFTNVIGPLAPNGGPTMTHRVLAGSPALNAIPNGTDSCGSAPFDKDQRGVSRPQPAAGGCDVGAYEYVAVDHLQVVVPATAAAGVPFSVTVNALDGSNNLVTAYNGLVHFTSTDGAAVLPADTPVVNGTATVSVTLITTGSQTLTATDAGDAAVTGTSSSIAVGPGPATHFVVSAPASATAGSSFSFTITALDQFNNTATGYTGAVHYADTEGVTGDVTLTNGVGTFSLTMVTAGNQTITATDTVTASITGTSNTISVSAGAATHYAVSAPASATAGSAFSVTVTAQDLFNNTATGYAGTVQFTSTDGAAVLPANSGLTNGTGTFGATLKTAGSQTITATDTVTASITGTSNTITVSAAAASHFSVTAPALATSGTAFSVTVTALDASNNIATGYVGTAHFTKTDSGPGSVLPADYAFQVADAGVHTFTNGVTLVTTGPQTVAATDTVTASITGTSNTITVQLSSDLGITIDDGRAYAVKGATIRYTIVVTNAGPNPATGALVTSTLPAGLIPAGPWTCTATGTPGGTCTATGGGPSINDTVSVPVGAFLTYTVPASVIPGALVSIGNTANVAVASGAIDPVSSNNSQTDTDTVVDRPHVGDFDGDGKTDVLLYNRVSRALKYWPMNGLVHGTEVLINSGASVAATARVVGVGDYDRSGQADVLWHDATANSAFLWLNGTSSSTPLPTPPAGAQILGSGDYNGDGVSDILWFNGSTGAVTIWLMNPLALSTPTLMPSLPTLPTAWKPVAAGDYDNNGYSDVFWQNTTTQQTRIWFFSPTGLQDQILSASGPAGLAVAGTGTYNTGDRFSDILWHKAGQPVPKVWSLTWTSASGTTLLAENDTTPGTKAGTFDIVGSGDYDNSNTADILWRDRTNGAIDVWLMGGATGNTVLASGTVGTPAPGPGASWFVVPNRVTASEISDFNSDGQSDLVWQNDSTGAASLWYLNGVILNGTAGIYNQPTGGWTIVGVGDFNHDGQVDIVAQNTNGALLIAFMAGNTVQSTQSLGTVPAGWFIRAVADFNNDGQSDILWQGPNQVALWQMSGAVIQQAMTIFSGALPGWTICGAADFNGDGQTDILWQGPNVVSVWQMNGTTIQQAVTVFSGALTGWTIRGAADFNGDGQADILWQTANQVSVWLMNGTTIQQPATIFTGSLAGWTIRAVR